MPSTNPAYSMRFTPEELAALRERAEREGKPVSEIIREALIDSAAVSHEASVDVAADESVPLRLVLYRGGGPARVTTSTPKAIGWEVEEQPCHSGQSRCGG